MSEQNKLHNLDSDQVNTDDILKILGHDYIRMLTSVESLDTAISGMRKFLYHETPEWKVEPKLNKIGEIVVKGIPQEILWQYQPENQEDFEPHQIIINRSMSAIPIVIEYLEERFWKLEHLKDPTPTVIQVPQMQPPPPIAKIGQPSISQRIQSMVTGKQIREDSPYGNIQEIREYYQEIPQIWSLLKEYHSTAVARKGVSWSSIMNRDGMENLLQILQSQFSYWIEPKLVEAVALADKVRVDKNKDYADRFIQALATQQRRHEGQDN